MAEQKGYPSPTKAAFFDRDGVLIQDYGYVYKKDKLTLLPGVAEALKRLKELNYLLLVVTNQSGVARGYFNLYDVYSFHRYLQQVLKENNAPRIDSFYVSPYHRDGIIPPFNCQHPDRKPGTGMLEAAIEGYNIDVANSFLVGDKESDVKAGKAMSIRSIQTDGQAHLLNLLIDQGIIPP